jgi:PRELI-like family.
MFQYVVIILIFPLLQIIGVDFVYFIQKNMLDFRSRTLNIEAHNESFSSRVAVLERCRYFVSQNVNNSSVQTE